MFPQLGPALQAPITYIRSPCLLELIACGRDGRRTTTMTCRNDTVPPLSPGTYAVSRRPSPTAQPHSTHPTTHTPPPTQADRRTARQRDDPDPAESPHALVPSPLLSSSGGGGGGGGGGAPSFHLEDAQTTQTAAAASSLPAAPLRGTAEGTGGGEAPGHECMCRRQAARPPTPAPACERRGPSSAIPAVKEAGVTPCRAVFQVDRWMGTHAGLRPKVGLVRSVCGCIHVG